MSFWSSLFGGGNPYDDEALIAAINKALMNDPVIADPESISVNSKEGNITLSGSLDKVMVKDHIEGVVREALRFQGLKFAQIMNEVEVRPSKMAA